MILGITSKYIWHSAEHHIRLVSYMFLRKKEIFHLPNGQFYHFVCHLLYLQKCFFPSKENSWIDVARDYLVSTMLLNGLYNHRSFFPQLGKKRELDKNIHKNENAHLNGGR